jgi:hypothetical protein
LFNVNITRDDDISHFVALPFTLKMYLKAKEEEELWKFKYFTMQKYI